MGIGRHLVFVCFFFCVCLLQFWVKKLGQPREVNCSHSANECFSFGGNSRGVWILTEGSSFCKSVMFLGFLVVGSNNFWLLICSASSGVINNSASGIEISSVLEIVISLIEVVFWLKDSEDIKWNKTSRSVV